MEFIIKVEKNLEEGGYNAFVTGGNKTIAIGDGETEFEALHDVLGDFEDVLTEYKKDGGKLL